MNIGKMLKHRLEIHKFFMVAPEKRKWDRKIEV